MDGELPSRDPIFGEMAFRAFVRSLLLWLQVVAFLAVSVPVAGQIPIIRLSEISPDARPLCPALEAYRIFQVHPDDWALFRNNNDSTSSLLIELGGEGILLDPDPVVRHSPPTRLILYTLDGPAVVTRAPSTLWRTRSDEGVWMLRDSLLAGSFGPASQRRILEPLWFHQPEAPRDLMIVYRESDVKPMPASRCGTGEGWQIQASPDPGHAPPARSVPGCKEIEYIIAVDWLFYNTYGSVFQVADRIETIMALVQGQYTGFFDNDYLIPIVDMIISTCPTCDPPEWTATTNAGTLLTNFRNWAEAGGFPTNAYDIGALWTGRDFDNNIIGVAYIDGVCDDNRYQCISDFNPSTSLMRSMVSHEIGHNFSAVHDPVSNFIMSPTVSPTTQWSGQSKTAINGATPSYPCLANCTINPPPVAYFTAGPVSGCAPLTVSFTDLSSNDPDGWSWQLPGATPSMSDQQHPVVTYGTYGTYFVSLTATNPYGSNTYTLYDLVTVNDRPEASFQVILDGPTVYFQDESFNAVTWFWDFGDGSTSTAQHPVHTYGKDSTYIVTLTTSNVCGQDAASQVFSVWTPPEAGFMADTTEGCSPLTVHFHDTTVQSITRRFWSFPGGSPDTGSLNPMAVTYQDTGWHSVMLIVENPSGIDTLVQNAFVRIHPLPDSAFAHQVSGDTLTVQYEGQVDTMWWDFGDGTQSPLPVDTHVYASEGPYQLTLHVSSACGPRSWSVPVHILRVPAASLTAEPDTGCIPLEVTFRYTGTPNVDSLFWSFPGGAPAVSSDTMAIVTYNDAGIYPVTLVAQNAAGADTLYWTPGVRVDDEPDAAFTWEAMDFAVTFTATHPAQNELLWTFGDGQSGAGSPALHEYGGPGTFTVQLLARNSCGEDSQDVQIHLMPTATWSPALPEGLQIWPNPVAETLNVRMDGEGRWQAGLYDLLGRPVAHAVVQGEAVRIPTAHLSPGIYFLQVTVRNGRYYVRVVVSPIPGG